MRSKKIIRIFLSHLASRIFRVGSWFVAADGRIWTAALTVTLAIPSLAARGVGHTAASERTPKDASGGEISLSFSLRGKQSRSLETLAAADLIVRDRTTRVDPRTLRLSRVEAPPLITLIFAELEDADTRRAASIARKVLKGMSEAALPTAVLQVSDRVRLIQAYTADDSAVDTGLRLLSKGNKQAIRDAEAAQEKQLADQLAQGGAGYQQDRMEALSRSLLLAPRLAAEQHMSAGIATVTAAAIAQKDVQSRKVFLLFTADNPSGAESGRMLRYLYERLADASGTLYVIDVRGLGRAADQAMLAATVVGNQSSALHAAIAAAPAPRPGTNPSAATEKTLNLTPAQFRQMTDTISDIEAGDVGRSSQNPLASIAVATGGTYVDADETGASLGKSISADLRHCYVLTFPGAPGAGEGKFHSLDVQFSERGVTVASQLGYLDRPAQGEADANSQEARNAKLNADWKSMGTGNATRELIPRAGSRTVSGGMQEVVVQLPIGRLQLHEDDKAHSFSLHVSMGAELEDDRGRIVARFLEDFDRDGGLENEAQARETVLRVSRTLDVPAGKYKLHAVVRDWFSDQSGEMTAAVVVSREDVLANRTSLPSESVAKTSASDLGLTAAALSEARTAILERGLVRTATIPLAPSEADALIEAARKSALSYAELLPNFLCVERIDRSVDVKGRGEWKHRDAISELLHYEDRKEQRTMLAINGEKSSVPADRIEGTRSNGEFGGILQTIFDPAAQATFKFERAMQEGTETLYVFSFQVKESRSEFFVTDEAGSKVRAGLHGLVYVQTSTHAVRRLLVETEGLPQAFGIRSSWMSLEYSSIAIDQQDYLLPTKGEVGMQRRKREIDLLQLRFGDYRRFGSHSTITYPTAELSPEPVP